jgi:post-segregation antitoxin (ccd killing protein)
MEADLSRRRRPSSPTVPYPLASSAVGCIFGCMPKMQVYLPDELYDRVKALGTRLNVSSILQSALVEALEQMERHEALGEAVRGYESKTRPFQAAELEARQQSDNASARRGTPRRRRASAA